MNACSHGKEHFLSLDDRRGYDGPNRVPGDRAVAGKMGLETYFQSSPSRDYGGICGSPAAKDARKKA